MVQPSNPNPTLEPAILTLGGQSYRLPVVEGSEGERAIDISNLRAQTGHITLDPGYGNTGSCESAITFIDGDQGILRYRGIPIEEFAASPTFIEVALLLIFGHLPNQAEYDEFSADLTRFAYLDEGMKHQFEGFPHNAPPMAILSAMINSLACYHPELHELEDERQFLHRGGAPDQQDPHHRRLRLSPLPRPALHLPRPGPALCAELPAHDVFAALPASICARAWCARH